MLSIGAEISDLGCFLNGHCRLSEFTRTIRIIAALRGFLTIAQLSYLLL